MPIAQHRMGRGEDPAHSSFSHFFLQGADSVQVKLVDDEMGRTLEWRGRQTRAANGAALISAAPVSTGKNRVRIGE